jgi:putative glycosyltransferase (TIGR04348 family)
MRIAIATPVASEAVIGNEHTARRYARLLRRLGHRVTVAAPPDVGPGDVLIALHARRSYPAVERFAAERPGQPLVLVLTGTDVYRDLRTHATAQRALELATRIVVLQQHALGEVPEPLQAKTRVIYQSAPCLRVTPPRPRTTFQVCVVGHLRPEKDPFRTALAARHLPPTSRVEVVHVGAALSDDMLAAVREESDINPRYRWRWVLPHWQARRVIAGSHLLAITSLMEGSSNVLCEALAQAEPTPVVASRIGGLVGTLGADYPGYFPVGDTRALAELLWAAESDPGFYAALLERCRRAAPLVEPEREQQAWAALLAELA